MEHRQRTGKRIKLNHSNAVPRHIIAFDTETLPTQDPTNPRRTIHKFRLGTSTAVTLRDGRPSERTRQQFTDTDLFWAYVESLTGPNYTTWVVGHNILFDLVISGWADQLVQSRFYIDWPRAKRTREDNSGEDLHSVGICCIESPPTIIACRCPSTNGRVVFVDSLNWFPVPLVEMGEACGMPKLEMPAFEAPDSEWFPYCQRDSDIVLETFVNLISWVKENDCGMFRYTAPAQAMAAYRHRFMAQQIFVHDNIPAKRLERSSYYGGRTEVFKIGQISRLVHQFDVNSLFPAIMRSGAFPFVLDRSDTETSLSTVFPNISFADSVAEVELQTLEPIFPVRRDGVTLYPVGKFTTILCGHELHYAIDKGYVRRVGNWAEYRCGDLFSLWVNELWQLRQNYKNSGNRLYEQFAKRLLNGLYGKFGQRSPGWTNVPGNISALPWSRWIQGGEMPNEVVNYRSIG